jgi:hypothetical protein
MLWQYAAERFAKDSTAEQAGKGDSADGKWVHCVSSRDPSEAGGEPSRDSTAQTPISLAAQRYFDFLILSDRAASPLP